MKQPVIIMLLALALVAGCGGVESEPVTESDNAEPIQTEPIQAEVTAMPEETLSVELQQVVLNAVGEQQNLPSDQLQIVSVEAADWPDACLGIATPDVLCAQIITPGWAITVTDGQQTWQYRTDLDATQVKLAGA
ncbi:MAG: hypothetical protein F6J95_008920 [Leptolyngbya sp. SIO1E4]|nr:hypothetical protein [Leptolyngbya sp. SIO1E4]